MTDPYKQEITRFKNFVRSNRARDAVKKERFTKDVNRLAEIIKAYENWKYGIGIQQVRNCFYNLIRK